MNIEKIKERLAYIENEANKCLQMKVSMEQNLSMLQGAKIECLNWLAQLEKEAADKANTENVEEKVE